MMLDLPGLKWKYRMTITGVLHCGAHLGEEAETYANLHLPVWWVEANPSLIAKIRSRVAGYGQHILQALLYKQDGVQLEFNVTNHDGMSSSILQFGTHPEFSPDTVWVDHITMRTTTIDTLVKENDITGCNLLVMDLQGAEGIVLEGARAFLEHVDFVFTEVNTAEVYKGCIHMEDLDALLAPFRRVETYLVDGQNWGDALYLRRSLGG